MRPLKLTYSLRFMFYSFDLILCVRDDSELLQLLLYSKKLERCSFSLSVFSFNFVLL